MRRCRAKLVLEAAAEMAGVGKATVQCHVDEAVLAVFNQVFGSIQTLLQHILVGRGSHGHAEHVGEVVGT